MISNLPDLFSLAHQLVRNVYSAGEGSVPSPAVAAAFSQLLWNINYQEALRWGQNAYDMTGDRDDAERSFQYGFANALGWSQAEFDAFWNDPNFDFTPEDAAIYDQYWHANPLRELFGAGGGR